ncbi:Tyrosine decarboxylase 1 [Diplonema papillatum]|nr:Tyrosine decarboxylase 1 [Diplonema papillatum]|eukprot:gene12114-18725_t
MAKPVPTTLLKPETLKQLGLETLNLLERHFEKLGKSVDVKPVGLKPGDLAAKFAEGAPSAPSDFSAILKDVEEKIMPGVTHWQHPQFMAYYPANTTVPSVLADAVITALGAVGLQWASCPIGTELEVVVMDWIAKLMGIDGPFLHTSKKGGGMIQSTASDIAAAVAVCARTRKHESLGITGEERFYADSSRFVRYESSDTHFSGKKAARVAGMRCRQIRPELLPDTGNYGITSRQVAAAIEEDLAQGLVPCMVNLNHGTTNTCGYDDPKGFKELAEKYDVWVHADCAFAGSALLLPERHGLSRELQEACTSFNINGSKWMLCGFDSAFLWVRDRRLLLNCFSASCDYMMEDLSAQSVYSPEFKDWAIPLGRRFRSLRVWMVLQYFGSEGIRDFIRDGNRQADYLRAQVDATEGFEQLVSTDLALVCLCVRNKAGDNVSEAVADALQEAGYFIGASNLRGTPMIRVALGGVNTTLAEVKHLWDALVAARDGKPVTSVKAL